MGILGWFFGETFQPRTGTRSRTGGNAAGTTPNRQGGNANAPLSRRKKRLIRELRADGLALRDIAKQVGVSLSTVSRVLGDTSYPPRLGDDRQEGAGGPVPKLSDLAAGLREYGEVGAALREVVGGDAPPAPMPSYDFEPDPDDDVDREERRLRLEEKRVQLEARRRFMGTSEYADLMQERMRRELMGGTRKATADPIDELLAQRRRYEEVSKVFGGGRDGEGGDWWRELLGELVRSAAPYVVPSLAALAAGNAAPSPPSPTRTDTGVPLAFTPTTAPAIPASPSANQPADADLGGTESGPDAVARGEPEAPLRSVLLALAQFVHGMPEEAARASFDWLVAEEEAEGPLVDAANNLLALPPAELLEVVLSYRTDTALGPLVQALEGNPAWALQYLVCIRELLASSPLEYEDDGLEPEPKSEPEPVPPPKARPPRTPATKPSAARKGRGKGGA